MFTEWTVEHLKSNIKMWWQCQLDLQVFIELNIVRNLSHTCGFDRISMPLMITMMMMTTLHRLWGKKQGSSTSSDCTTVICVIHLKGKNTNLHRWIMREKKRWKCHELNKIKLATNEESEKRLHHINGIWRNITRHLLNCEWAHISRLLAHIVQNLLLPLNNFIMYAWALRSVVTNQQFPFHLILIRPGFWCLTSFSA